tara:strand:- start:90 stop:1367 length:1278 start_codon:yes stop_codon:yes gene_type:complete
MPKILLVTLPREGEVIDRVTHKFFKNPVVKYMPLGVLSIAANLKKWDTKVLDASSRGLSVEQTIEEINTFAPDILGLSVVTYRAWAMTEILKKTNAKIKAVGGPHATSNAENILSQGADAVFRGDAEKTFPQWIEDGCPNGIFDGGIVDLNEIPFPDRTALDLDDYKIEKNDDLLFDAGSLRLPMSSSKGCPYLCTYCDVQQKEFNWKSPENIVKEFDEIIKLGVTSIHILDDCFNVRRDRIEKFCKLLVESDVPIVDWSARGMVEVREPVVAALAEAGCKRLHVGIEHLDDQVLINFKKQQRYSHVKIFCDLAAKYKIDVLGYFIIGAPGETEEYRKNLPHMIQELNIQYPFFNVLSPLSESPYYDECRKSGLIKGDPWADFSANPVKDFPGPCIRDFEEDRELHSTIAGWNKIFFSKHEEIAC